MKKNNGFIIFALFAMLAFTTSCMEMEDAGDNESELDSRLTALEERVSALEILCFEMNNNINSLKGIINAIETRDYITAITPVIIAGVTKGYTITFAKNDPIIIYHGKDGTDGHTPVIGVKQDNDGFWYWTIDGDWLFDSNGQKVKAIGIDGQEGQAGHDGENGKNGFTPQLKIEDGYWFVSTDDGISWTQLGKATGENGNDGDTMFSGIDYTTNSDYVIFTLSDGTVIQVPTWYAFEELKTLCYQLNNNIASLQEVVNAISSGYYITSVTPIIIAGMTLGYTINFDKGDPITIYHGKDGKDGADGVDGQDGQDGKDGKDGKDGQTPVIGVKQDSDGVWYWTICGEWLLDSNNQKVRAIGTDGQDGEDGKDGITPQLKIEEGYWFVSIDNGQTWTQMGKATGEDGQDGLDGDPTFANIDYSSSQEYVVFVLSDGTELCVPTWYAFERLSEMCNQMNSNIAALQVIVDAIQSEIFISSVTTIIEEGKEKGFLITFSNGEQIMIYHGKDGQNGAEVHTPLIGVKQDTDGIWYWTVDGEWLLDADKKKVKAVGTDGADGQNGANGITPQLKIENDYWYVSIDNGLTWTQLGKAKGEDGQNGSDGTNGVDGDSFFQSVSVTESDVTFVTSDGQTFVIKRTSALSIEFDVEDLVAMAPNSTRIIHYSITSGIDDIDIEALSSADLKVKLSRVDAKTGQIQVKTGDVIDEYSKLVVVASNGVAVVIKHICFEEIGLCVSDNAAFNVPAKGSDLELHFLTNTEFDCSIPEDCQSWISIVQTKAMSGHSVLLNVKANSGDERTARVTVSARGSDLLIVYTITQAKSVQGNIVFADPVIKGICVKAYDTDGDGELSYAEAAEVKILGGKAHFGAYRRTDVVSFDELQYFTSLEEIGEFSFYYCTSLKSIVLPKSVKSIDESAFCGCSSLKTIRLPENVEIVGNDAFNDCSNAEFIFESNKLISLGVRAFYGCERITQLSFPTTLNSIGNGCFTSCSNLQSVYLPEGLESLGNDAFKWCYKLSDINIPVSISKIGNSVFYYCTSLKNISIPDSVTEIGDGVFSCSGITELLLPDNYHGIIGASLCQGCEDLKRVRLGQPSRIEYDAFMDCFSLEELYIPQSVESIGEGFIGGCRNLTSISGKFVLSDHRSVVYDKTLVAFVSGGAGDFSYIIPEGVERIGNRAFMRDEKIAKIIIPDYVKEVGFNAFLGCESLTEMSLSSVESIGSGVFAGCKNLKHVDMPQSLKVIPGDMFGDCSSLTSIEIPSKVEKICVLAFYNCSSLDTIYCKPVYPPLFGNLDEVGGLDSPKVLVGTPSNQKILVADQSIEFYRNAGGWSDYKDRFDAYDYPDISEPDYYTSQDYSRNGNVNVIQKATTGNSINLVFMGDAFVDKDINSGKYHQIIEKACDAFFSEEPYKSYRHLFNVYEVEVVSASEGYTHYGRMLGTYFGGGSVVGGNDATVLGYAENAVDASELNNTLVIVLMNRDYYAGTCYMYYDSENLDYGCGTAIAYCPLGTDDDVFVGIITHEAGGHGFAKLGDEYNYSGTISDSEKSNFSAKFKYGWWKNIDFTSNLNEVKWNRFLKDSRYSSESLGLYEGACTYKYGAYRPSENSIMRHNTGGYNAPSRYAIWYRIGKLAYGNSWEGGYEEFTTYDQVNRSSAAVQRRQGQISRQLLSKPLHPLAPPVIVGQSWREAMRQGN